MDNQMTKQGFNKLLNDILIASITYNRELNSYSAHRLDGTVIIMTYHAVMYSGNNFETTLYLSEDQGDHLFAVLEFTYFRETEIKRIDFEALLSEQKESKALIEKVIKTLPKELDKYSEYFYNTLHKDGIDFFKDSLKINEKNEFFNPMFFKLFVEHYYSVKKKM